MNENEQNTMKDDSASRDTRETYTEQTASAQDTYTAADTDGLGYTNPDGTHGFIYNARAEEAETRSRRYRGALIAVSVLLVGVLAVGGCCFGAYMAARNLNLFADGTDRDTDLSGELGTSDGLYISEETGEPSVNDTATSPEENRGTPGEAVTLDASVEAPENATIQKLPPKRTDADGDGQADIAYDASGNVLTSAGDADMTVATVVNKIAASVVEITTETIVQSGYIGQYVTGGAGSGVIIAEEGFIVTNHHVIDGANTITVRLKDGTEFPARLVGSDEQTDIAVLWIDPGAYELTVATMGASYDLVVGEDILAIGNPLGSLGGTVTEGMISATARQISISGTNMTLLQVSAPINPGNSGGGLFNLAGELVGVVNAKMSSEEIEGLGFAIPSDTAYTIVCELIGHGYVRGRPALDFTVTDVSSMQTALYYFNSRYTGVYVIEEGHETMEYGDLIYAADGVEISTVAELEAIVRQKAVGDTVELAVYRNKAKITVTVTLTEALPEMQASP